MKRTLKLAGGLALLLMLVACAAGSAESQHAAAGGLLHQAALGFWHGVIAPVTLLAEIVNRLAPHVLSWKPRLYEARGTGIAYDVGFYLGLVTGPAGAWGASRRR